eukprot:scaffold14014_cov18-Tisochrysis_lutea.AAC.2
MGEIFADHPHPHCFFDDEEFCPFTGLTAFTLVLPHTKAHGPVCTGTCPTRLHQESKQSCGCCDLAQSTLAQHDPKNRCQGCSLEHGTGAKRGPNGPVTAVANKACSSKPSCLGWCQSYQCT